MPFLRNSLILSLILLIHVFFCTNKRTGKNKRILRNELIIPLKLCLLQTLNQEIYPLYTINLNTAFYFWQQERYYLPVFNNKSMLSQITIILHNFNKLNNFIKILIDTIGSRFSRQNENTMAMPFAFAFEHIFQSHY